MKRLKGIRFRLYPSDAQRQTLAEWERSLRSLWNLAHEQRLRAMERPKDERLYYTAFDQMLQLTELRAAYPWFAAVPRHVCSSVLDDLDKAWQRCFKGLGYQPRWKKRGDSVGFTESEASKFSVDGTRLHFPKLGTVRIVLHTPIVGKPKRCTLRREAGGEWYASILLETEVDEPAAREEPMVAIDRGVVLLLADSDGRIVENPKHLEQTAKVLARAQRIVARRKKGSKNREKAKLRVAKLHAKVSRQREYARPGTPRPIRATLGSLGLGIDGQWSDVRSRAPCAHVLFARRPCPQP